MSSWREILGDQYEVLAFEVEDELELAQRVIDCESISSDVSWIKKSCLHFIKSVRWYQEKFHPTYLNHVIDFYRFEVLRALDSAMWRSSAWGTQPAPQMSQLFVTIFNNIDWDWLVSFHEENPSKRRKFKKWSEQIAGTVYVLKK